MVSEKTELAIGGIGVVFAIVGYANIQKIGRLAKSGVKTEGVVFSVEREMDVDIGIGNQNTMSTSSYPIIRFVTVEKEWVTQKYNVSTFPKYQPGDKVTVIYNPQKITEFILDDMSTKIIGYFFWLGILLIAIAAGLFALLL